MNDGWIDLASGGRIIGYTTEPSPGMVSLPADVPCHDELVVECRAAGTPVYPIREGDGQP